MKKFKLAVVQMNALRGALDHNLETHRHLAREAASAGCKLVMFPELSVTAHFGSEDVTHLAEEASEGRIYTTMFSLARELNCVIGYGFCESAHGTFYNAYALAGPKGMIGVQRKVHASLDEYLHFRMGQSFEVFDLDFCRVGILVCFDASFCEAWRVMALKQADVLLLPHAGRSGIGEEISEDQQRKTLEQTLTNLPGRYGFCAADNHLFAVYGNQVGYNGHTTHSGGAYIIDPEGKLLAESPISLGDLWLSAELDPEALDKARNSPYSVLRARRPEMYQEVTRMI